MAVRESGSRSTRAGAATGVAKPASETPAPEVAQEAGRDWTFLTNHARVLLCIAADPDVRLRDVAASVGITERATQHIVHQLEAAGYLERERVGRRNRYQLHADLPLRHPMDHTHQVSELLAVLGDGVPPADTARR